MSPLVQELLVFVIVGVATVYASLKFMPAAWRRRLAAKVAAMAAHAGLSEADARRVEAKLSTGGACGSCDSCKACATPKPDASGDGAAFSAASPSAHRSIPIRRAP